MNCMNIDYNTFSNFIDHEYYQFDATDYGNWYYGDYSFVNFRTSINEITHQWMNNSITEEFNCFMEENSHIIADEDKIIVLYDKGEISITDEEALEYMEENNVSDNEIVNYLINGDFDDTNRTINNYGLLYDQFNNNWGAIVDERAIASELANWIDILQVGKTWFFDFREGDGVFFDENDDIFAQDFYEAVEECGARTDADPAEVPELDDDIGDITELSAVIDYDNRDYAAIYLGNGNFIVGDDSGQSHTQILNKWLKQHQKEKSSSDWYRVSAEEVQDTTQAEAVAFCHIIDDCVFVDVNSEMINCNGEEVIDAAMATGDYSKGYIYRSSQNTIERIANKRLISNEILKLYQKLGKRVYVQQIR